jgi:hypothetical protein
LDGTLEHNGRESWYSFIQVVGKGTGTATWMIVSILDEARDQQLTRKSVVPRSFVRNPTRASVARSARKTARRNKGDENEEEETLLAMAQASYLKNCDGVCRGQRSPSQVLESETPSYAAHTQGAKALAPAESVLFGVCTLLATSAPLWT